MLASAVNANNTQRLLAQQVAQAATLLTTQVAVIQTQMADAGQVVDATHGRPPPFTSFADATITVPGCRCRCGGSAGSRSSNWPCTVPTRSYRPAARPPPSPACGDRAADRRRHPGGPQPRLAYALMPAGESMSLTFERRPSRLRTRADVGARFTAHVRAEGTGAVTAVYDYGHVPADACHRVDVRRSVRGPAVSLLVADA